MPRRRRGVEARGATPPDARGSERARRIRRRVRPPRFRAPRLREAFIDRSSDARGSGRETTTYRLLESSRRRDLGGERRGVHGVERAVGCAGRAPRARSRDASSRAVSHRNASQGTARVSDWRRMGTGISADFRGDGESRLSQQWRRRRIAYSAKTTTTRARPSRRPSFGVRSATSARSPRDVDRGLRSRASFQKPNAPQAG